MRTILFEEKFNILIRLSCVFIIFSLGACAPKIGEELSNSFDNPEFQSEAQVRVKNSDKEKEIRKNKNKKNKKNKDEQNKIKKVLRTEEKFPKKIKKFAFTPKPYRIIIKLSAANPASPSEAVTNALIKAGVRFEVEMIERLEDKDDLKGSIKRGVRR